MQLTDKQKYQIIILRDEGYKIDDIANKIKINRKSVMKWINNYQLYENISRKKGSGRKKITSFIDNENIISIIKENNDLTIREITNMAEKININVSKSTIHRILINNDFIYKFPFKKPLLTETHKKNRLEWTKKYINQDWNKIIFSDETCIRISGFNKKKWIHKDDISILRTVKFPLKKTFGDVFFKITLVQ